jgi:phosphatidylserine/phosphatidylglycerophosphate/cardiolipin synthase-like enzyme
VTRLLGLLVAITCFLVVPTGASASAAPDHFNPRPGVTFNSPLGDTATRRAIFHKIIRSIDSSARGSEIKIFTWNFLTSDATTALLKAQNRGVMVRLLMDNKNNVEIPNQPYRRLVAGLHQGNRDVARKSRHSWARTCFGSCRGTTGSAHAKFFMFSHVGKVRRVVMQGSANLTLASTNNQWNDIYTHTRNAGVWHFYDQVFLQAAEDSKKRRPFAAQTFDGFRLMMFPIAAQTQDPVLNLLNKVRCRKAGNTTSHRTVIRIAPDVIRRQRGMVLARKVRALWEQGCDIKVGYTVVGVQIGRMLRSPGGRGPVPMKHLVQDLDGDGEFDNYFHLKSMSIVGNVGGNRSGYVVLNGSANWSGLARVSDENLGIYWNKELTLRYQDHIDYWYTNFPQSGSSRRSDLGARRTTGSDLVFGSGKDAVYEDGTPYSEDGVDPYAKLALD